MYHPHGCGLFGKARKFFGDVLSRRAVREVAEHQSELTSDRSARE